MDSNHNNVIFIFNEYFMLFDCDFLLVFSDFTSSTDKETALATRYKIGYFYIAILCVSVLFNIGLLIYIVIQDIKYWRRLKKEK